MQAQIGSNAASILLGSEPAFKSEVSDLCVTGQDWDVVPDDMVFCAAQGGMPGVIPDGRPDETADALLVMVPDVVLVRLSVSEVIRLEQSWELVLDHRTRL